ncbi:hypothetical protein BG011_002746 [Mortierella polycephala]|uniref:Protein-serine/threonine kinase n=1 Tax=Mortierella polycephala TaxID=41804 RepID=A0A9P6U4W8_9FUNG|nr:hypothetical protein BG011_002746 [Mortierella polycephala]
MSGLPKSLSSLPGFPVAFSRHTGHRILLPGLSRLWPRLSLSSPPPVSITTHATPSSGVLGSPYRIRASAHRVFYGASFSTSSRTSASKFPTPPTTIIGTRRSKRHYTSSSSTGEQFYRNRILDPYVNQAVNPITLRQLVFFGRNMQPDKLLKSANYVRTELPIRLAHRIRDFQNLPFIVGTNPHIELVYDLYWQAFESLHLIPEIKTLDENEQFCHALKGLLNDHLVVIPQLALGIMECAKHIGPPEVVDQFMNKMLRSRISRRVLAEQHISLTANYNSPNHMLSDRGYIGIIYTHCNPRDIIERTAVLAAETCRRQQGLQRNGMATSVEPPKVVMDGNLDAEFSYIPDHIEYILYELLKNSMRFVMSRAELDPRTGKLPPIQITVCEGTHDIVFRVSDKGGGIDPELEGRLWSYAQTPARFANFEKISRMAATVQEQMVSPSRSINAAENDDEEERHRAARPPDAELDVLRQQRGFGDQFRGGSVNSDNGHRERVILPPPVNCKAGSNLHETIFLDRNAPSAPPLPTHRPNPTDPSTVTSSPPPPPRSTSVIDPSRASTPQSKVGHLDRDTQQEAEHHHARSMHLGIGLPMSKVYAEYWGGDLQVFSMHGYGTDAYAHLCKFGNIYENFDR